MNDITKQFAVFDNKKQVEIKVELIRDYEKKVGHFTDKTVSYLIVTLGLEENLPVEELEKEIEKAMIEDCNDSSIVKEILSDESRREEIFT